jgi:Ca-activated chloride channel family protein
MSPRTFELHDPWVLALIAPAAALLLWSFRRKAASAAIVFPSLARLHGLRPTWRQRLRLAIPVLQALALLGLIIAGARPRQGDARTIVRRQGIAIQMVLDRSSSMEEVIRYGGRERKRIDIVKDVFTRFVAGDASGAGSGSGGSSDGSGAESSGGQLAGRQNDLLGLTTFARFTEESCPFVALHEPLVTAVKSLTTVAPFLDEYRRPTWNRQHAKEVSPLNATAIGDGLYRAVLSLVTAEEDLARGEDEGGYKIKGKVAILLTDGENNAGRDPVEAGRYAGANGVRVYYIVFREPTLYRETIFGRQAVKELSEDEILAEPRRVVEPSEGRAFLAQSGEELRAIYEEIDRLERTDVGRIEFRSYHEKYHWFLVPALACLVLAALLGETVLRRIP